MKGKCPICKGCGEFLFFDGSGKDYDGERILRCYQCRTGLELTLQEVEQDLAAALDKLVCWEKEIERLETERKSLKNRLRSRRIYGAVARKDA